MTTDDTARAILDYSDSELYRYDPPSVQQERSGVSGFSPLFDVSVTDLQRMARLWLMRDEILQRLAIGRVPAADYIVNLDGAPTSDLYARIRDIDKLASLESE